MSMILPTVDGNVIVHVYTLSTVQILPTSMGSVDALEHPNIIEIVKQDLDQYTLKKRYPTKQVYVHQWRIECGIFKQEMQLGT